MSTTLRLNWPQWQGGEPRAVDGLTAGLDDEQGRLAYGIGGQITALLAPVGSGPSETVPVGEYDPDPIDRDGIVAKDVVLGQNASALEMMRAHDADRVITLGGSCSVSMAPFSYLADRYQDDLAVIWLDGHADCNIPGGPNHGLNTMVVTHLIGRGDSEVLDSLPGRIAPSNVLLAGARGWDDQDPSHIESWGLKILGPAAHDEFVGAVVDWVRSTGCANVALHFDLDVIDSDEIAFGMAWEPNGITVATAVATINAVADAANLVGLTVAEFVPRQAMVLRTILRSLPGLTD
jgi:arginase